MTTARKTFHGVWILLVIAVAAALIAGEMLLRLTGQDTTDTQILYKGIIAKNRPYARFVWRKENRNRVVLNNWGFHDRTRKNAGPGERILVLGDSFVEGMQVPVDSLFTSVLERKLEDAGYSAEVINAGVSGVGTAYEYLLWKEFFKGRVKIDRILLCMYMGNDLENNVLGMGAPPASFGVYLDEQGNPIVNRVNFGPVKKLVKKIRQYSVLANAAYERLYQMKCRMYFAQKEQRTVQGRTETNAATQYEKGCQSSVKGTLALLCRWIDELTSDNISFVIAVLDCPGKAAATTPGYGQDCKDLFVSELADLCREKEIAVLNIDLQQEAEQCFFTTAGMFGHLTPQGHRRVAEITLPALVLAKKGQG